MKSTEQRIRFVEMRGRGMSLGAIARETGVGKSTPARWSAEYRTEVEEQAAQERERIAARLNVADNRRFERYCALLDKITTRVGKDHLEIVPTEKLLRMAMMLDEKVARQLRRRSGTTVAEKEPDMSQNGTK